MSHERSVHVVGWMHNGALLAFAAPAGCSLYRTVIHMSLPWLSLDLGAVTVSGAVEQPLGTYDKFTLANAERAILDATLKHSASVNRSAVDSPSMVGHLFVFTSPWRYGNPIFSRVGRRMHKLNVLFDVLSIQLKPILALLQQHAQPPQLELHVSSLPHDGRHPQPFPLPPPQYPPLPFLCPVIYQVNYAICILHHELFPSGTFGGGGGRQKQDGKHAEAEII